MASWVGLFVVGICSLPFLVVAVRASGARQLAFAYARRRPAQMVLVGSGIVVASAMFVSAAVVGDSLRASIRRSVVEQLGPIDVEVVRPGVDPAPVEAAIAQAPGARGATTLPFVATLATIRGRDFVARVSQAPILEVDFGAAGRFGGGAAHAGITGTTPTGTGAVMSADLSDAIAIKPGHRVTVYAFGAARTFTVTSVLPRHALAGLRTPLSPPGSASYNLFLPPGTIRDMVGDAANDARGGQSAPEAIVAVAYGRHGPASRPIAAAIQAAAPAAGADVRPVRQQLLDDASRRSRSVTDLFRAFALFGALAGVVLLVLSLAVLARERVRAIAMLRAHGLRRRGAALALLLEGWLYAAAGTVAGALCGYGLARLVVVVARHAFQSSNSTNVDLAFSARLGTVVSAAAAVFVVALLTVVANALLIARRNVVSAMRGLPEARARRHGRAAGVVLVVVGVVVAAAGIATGTGVAAVAGPALAGVGVVLCDGEHVRRGLVAVVALVVATWSVLVVGLVPRAWTTLTGALIVAEGLVMTGAVLAIAATAMRDARLGNRGHRRRASALASVYARQPSWRTVAVAATYATLLFMLTVLVTVRGVYQRDTNDLARRLGGASTLEVSSNASAAVPPADVARLDGVVHVKQAATVSAQITTASASATRDVTAVGIDDAWEATGSPPLDHGPSAATRDAYGAVVRDPSRVLVGADLYADRQSGFPRGLPSVGDRIQVRLPATGAQRTLTVAGVVAAARYDGADHVYVSRTLLDSLLGSPAVSNLLFVETQPHTNANVLAAVIDGTHLQNGTYARSFTRLARESNSARTQFLDISAGYAAVGLVAALIALALVMIDRVRDRRRQLAALRAFGVSAAVVRRSVRIETGLVALAGMLVGVGCGLMLTWRFERIDAFTNARVFSIPLLPIVGGVLVVLAASLGAAAAAARRSARLQPARALRVDD